VRYLYNNGYDGAKRRWSVGLLSKVLSLKDAIETGLSRYDFLKGAEAYKQRLGGREIELLRYRVRFPGGYGRD
jgi:CelD/BcsL family acetyltransferase involved in cellulose biosynthesis